MEYPYNYPRPEFFTNDTENYSEHFYHWNYLKFLERMRAEPQQIPF